MLQLFNHYSRGRIAWSLLLLVSVAFELTALYFQYVMAINPCVLCIYQRTALCGIILAAVIALITPRNFLLRLSAILLWLYCSVKGLLSAYQQARLQFEINPFHFCPVHTDFPHWLPLNRLLPFFFESSGSCTLEVWHFLTLAMSQWMLLIFACYALVALLVLIAQPVRLPKKARWCN